MSAGQGNPLPTNRMDPGEPLAVELLDNPRPRRSGAFAGWAIILFVVVLVVGPLLYVYLPRETARWHMAASIEQRLDGDLDAAIRSITRAIDQFPENEELYRQRAEWRMENQQFPQALQDAQRAVRLAPQSIEGYLVRSQVYQHLGRHAEAVADWNTLVDLATSRGGLDRAALLNGRAYARALAGLELDEALSEIEQALQFTGQDAAMLDTRGFIHYRRGNFTAARRDMEQAVVLAEADHAQRIKLVEKRRLGFPDPREDAYDLKRHAQNVAVIRYHRAMVYDQLRLKDRADEDRRRVQQLGFEPNADLF